MGGCGFCEFGGVILILTTSRRVANVIINYVSWSVGTVGPLLLLLLAVEDTEWRIAGEGRGVGVGEWGVKIVGVWTRR